MVSRRLVLGLGAGALAVAAVGYAQRSPGFDGQALAPDEAQRLANLGQVTLIDIRRPEEWAQTGVGVGAQPLDMRRADFIEALTRIADPKTPIALICASGVRSARLATQLRDAGFTQVINVPEGMLGSRAGPGWLRRGLPVTQP